MTSAFASPARPDAIHDPPSAARRSRRSRRASTRSSGSAAQPEIALHPRADRLSPDRRRSRWRRSAARSTRGPRRSACGRAAFTAIVTGSSQSGLSDRSSISMRSRNPGGIVAARLAQVLHRQREAAGYTPIFSMPTGVAGSRAHGVQSRPPVRRISWPLMKPRLGRGRNSTAARHLGQLADAARRTVVRPELAVRSRTGRRASCRCRRSRATTTLLVMPLRPYSLASRRQAGSPALLAP